MAPLRSKQRSLPRSARGTQTIVIKKDDAAVAADNPEWTISNTMIANYPITYTVGELQVMEVSFEGGSFVRDVTP
jgi:hypothetical protein